MELKVRKGTDGGREREKKREREKGRRERERGTRAERAGGGKEERGRIERWARSPLLMAASSRHASEGQGSVSTGDGLGSVGDAA